MTWPALIPDEDGDDADELEEWMQDPFKRRILYSFYALSELIKVAVVSILTIIGVALIVTGTETAASSEPALVWIAVAVSLIIVLVDTRLNNPIRDLSMGVTYYLFVAAAHLYFGLKDTRSKGPDVEEDAFADWLSLFPAFRFLKKRERKRIF